MKVGRSVAEVRPYWRRQMLARYATALAPSHWATTDDVESLCNVLPGNGMLMPDMSLLDWQSNEDSTGISHEIAKMVYRPVIDSQRGVRYRKTESGEWTTAPRPPRLPPPPRIARYKPPPKHTAWDVLINGLSRWSAKTRVRNTVRALKRAQETRLEAQRVKESPCAETYRGAESAFVPLGRRHVFLDSDGCWRCMNGNVTEANGKGDYLKLLGMDTSSWFELLRSAGVPA